MDNPRDETQARINALKEKAEKEYQNYLQELKDLDRQLEQDRNLKEFMTIKVTERTSKLVKKQSTSIKMILN